MRPLLLAVLAGLLLAAPAAAGPVATSDAEYAVEGRVFTDPLGGCAVIGTSPCDPAAEGNLPAVSFIGVNEFRDGLAYLNSKPEWQRYMEVLILDGKDGDGAATKAQVTADPNVMFPGDQLPPEFTPNPKNVSAGLPTTTLDRQKSDLTIVRVTDETVPDAGKKRMTLSLSIHGIERAGVEGGTRAMEDLVTAATTDKLGAPIVDDAVRKGAPTFKDVLAHTIVYFTYPNPDGWRRGTFDSGGLGSSFQRYNGNGVDPNRDYIDIGYNFRGYSGGSEPETRAFKGFYRDLLGDGATFQAGDDLHGQPFADALSYTLLPHGRHDLGKDTRIRETAKLINRAQYEATKWNPRIKANDEISAPQDTCIPAPATGSICPAIYAQTWGSVYDTINYTTTGTLGDWFDSSEGLSADGIDNEMSFSHVDKQIRFEQDTEQLHVAGNKSIIYAHLADLLAPQTGQMTVPGPQGYVPNARLVRKETQTQPGAPAGTKPQDDISGALALPDPTADGGDVYAFKVDRSPTIFNGGMTVKATGGNVQGVQSGSVKLYVQCRHCDDHVGAKDAAVDDWITVSEDYNQSPIYLQAGAIASVNLPDPVYSDAAGKEQPVEWRALVTTAPLGVANLPGFGPARIDIEFSSGPATDDGNSAGDEAPLLKAYDVANTDFFEDLNKFIPSDDQHFRKVDPRKVIAGDQALTPLHSLVLADELLPGYNATDPAASAYTKGDYDTWVDKLRQFTRGGGNLVLTDKALMGLSDLVPAIGADKVHSQTVYAGQMTVTRCKDAKYEADGTCTEEERTLEDPLLKNVNQPGSRFNTGFRRQLFEPTPIGFAIQDATGGDASTAIQYDIDAKSFTDAGGRVAATSADDSPRSTSPITSRVTVGELPLGNGHIRVAGALLPQPSEQYDHPLGLTPYAVTYTGYILVCNLLDADCTVTPAKAGTGTPGTGNPGTGNPGTGTPGAGSCPVRSGFKSASATPAGHGLRFRFARKLKRPVTIDVYQTSRGRRIIGNHRVAHFGNLRKGLKWNGAEARSSGVYSVRIGMRIAKGVQDVRRFGFRRVHGRFVKAKQAYRRDSCSLLKTYHLRFGAFGGPRNRPLAIRFRVKKASQVAVVVSRVGGGVVKRFRARTVKRNKLYRLTLPAQGLARGEYVVRLTVKRGAQTVRATLVARRL
jgi:hypothetical protein